MTHQDRSMIIARLDAACTHPNLTDKARTNAANMLAALRRPVRIGLFGLPDAQTCLILNGLAGQRLLPCDSLLPPTQISFASTPRVSTVLDDNSKQTHSGPFHPDILLQNPVFMRLETNAPLLSDQSYLVLTPDADADEIEAALDWGMPQCDMVLWCTTRWTAIEQRVWRQKTSELSGHSSLVIVRDIQGEAPGDLIQAGPSDGFEAVLPLLLDTDPVRVVAPLRAYLKRAIEDARTEDLLAAMMFLKRYAANVQINEVPAVQPAPSVQVRPSTVATPRRRAPVPQTRPVPQPRDVAPKARHALARSFHFLRSRAHGLRQNIPIGDLNPAQIDTILNTVDDTLDCLLGHFDAEDSLCDTWPSLRDAATEAQELGLLLRLEGGQQQAFEAATLLYQLRRDVEHALAA